MSNFAVSKRVTVSSWGRYIATEFNWVDVLTKSLVSKKYKDTLEDIIGSKPAYTLVVTEKGFLVQYVDSYFLLVTYAEVR